MFYLSSFCSLCSSILSWLSFKRRLEHWLVCTLLILYLIDSICYLTLSSFAFKDLLLVNSTGVVLSSSCSGRIGKLWLWRKLLHFCTLSLYSGSLEYTEFVEASVTKLFWVISYGRPPKSLKVLWLLNWWDCGMFWNSNFAGCFIV